MTTYTIIKTADKFKIIAMHPPAPGFKAERHTTIAEGNITDPGAFEAGCKMVAFANLANTLASVVETAQEVQNAAYGESFLPA